LFAVAAAQVAGVGDGVPKQAETIDSSPPNLELREFEQAGRSI